MTRNITLGLLEVLDMSLTVNMSCSLTRFQSDVRNHGSSPQPDYSMDSGVERTPQKTFSTAT